MEMAPKSWIAKDKVILSGVQHSLIVRNGVEERHQTTRSGPEGAAVTVRTPKSLPCRWTSRLFHQLSPHGGDDIRSLYVDTTWSWWR